MHSREQSRTWHNYCTRGNKKPIFAYWANWNRAKRVSEISRIAMTWNATLRSSNGFVASKKTEVRILNRKVRIFGPRTKTLGSFPPAKRKRTSVRHLPYELRVDVRTFSLGNFFLTMIFRNNGWWLVDVGRSRSNYRNMNRKIDFWRLNVLSIVTMQVRVCKRLYDIRTICICSNALLHFEKCRLCSVFESDKFNIGWRH